MKNYWNYWPDLLFPQEIKPNLSGKKSIGDLGNQTCACFLFSPSLIASRCAAATWTADFTPDLSAVGRPGGGGGGDVIVVVVGAGMRTGAGDEPIRFDADRGAATGGGSRGIAGRVGSGAALGFAMEVARKLRPSVPWTARARGGAGCCGFCGQSGLSGFTRFGPLKLCGLICGFVGACGSAWPSGLAV
jgi:hypothetical protein